MTATLPKSATGKIAWRELQEKELGGTPFQASKKS